MSYAHEQDKLHQMLHCKWTSQIQSSPVSIGYSQGNFPYQIFLQCSLGGTVQTASSDPLIPFCKVQKHLQPTKAAENGKTSMLEIAILQTPCTYRLSFPLFKAWCWCWSWRFATWSWRLSTWSLSPSSSLIRCLSLSFSLSFLLL